MSASRPSFDPQRMKAAAGVVSVPAQLTVSGLNSLVKHVLADHLPATLHVVGEISNFTRHSSGHLYFTLKDEQSELRCVMWKAVAGTLKFKPADGLEVIATGGIEVYTVRGQYQLQVRRLEPRGTGSLELAFRQLRDKLAREGLFDPLRKRPLPRYPLRIAVVTSPTGAAVRDILQTLHRRWPCADLLLHPARVQGEGAAAEIAAAIDRLNALQGRLGPIDVMIVGRGGGSLEDLWAFNDELLARAIVRSAIPIISGVGHEVDTTIADLAADVRAATPTAAAELAAPVLTEVLEGLRRHADRLHRAARQTTALAAARLDGLARSEGLRDPAAALGRRSQRLDDASTRLQLVLTRRIEGVRQALHDAQTALAAREPRRVLAGRALRLQQLQQRLLAALQSPLQRDRARLHRAEIGLIAARPDRGLARQHDRLGQLYRDLLRTVARRQQASSQDMQRLDTQLGQAGLRQLRNCRQRWQHLSERLESLSYRRTLARGFTLTRDARTGRLITAADQVRPEQIIRTDTAQGGFDSQVLPGDS